MTNIPVLISITSRSHAAGDITEIKSITTGTFSGVPDDYTITYEEKEEELKGCVTELHVENQNRVTMTRSGKYKSEMVISKERTCPCNYITPYGVIKMDTFARHVDSDIENGEGKLNFFYMLSCDGSLLAENELTIKIKRK